MLPERIPEVESLLYFMSISNKRMDKKSLDKKILNKDIKSFFLFF